MDFHCHLDLYPNAKQVYRQACERNAFTWLVTTSPKAYAATSRVLGTSPNVLITPGLHPEIAHERAEELDLMLEQIATVRAVGEVGLDGSLRFRGTYNVQHRIFSAIIARCEELGGRTLSIHSRQAVKDVLAVLGQHPGFGMAILHWFSGTATELKAAVAQGCWFSVGPAMLKSGNGKNLAKKIPRDRVLPESDGPFAQIDGGPVMPWSAKRTAEDLAEIWGVPVESVDVLLRHNSEKMLMLMGLRE